jgi:hypothetical protein
MLEILLEKQTLFFKTNPLLENKPSVQKTNPLLENKRNSHALTPWHIG